MGISAHWPTIMRTVPAQSFPGNSVFRTLTVKFSSFLFWTWESLTWLVISWWRNASSLGKCFFHCLNKRVSKIWIDFLRFERIQDPLECLHAWKWWIFSGKNCWKEICGKMILKINTHAKGIVSKVASYFSRIPARNLGSRRDLKILSSHQPNE